MCVGMCCVRLGLLWWGFFYYYYYHEAGGQCGCHDFAIAEIFTLKDENEDEETVKVLND